MSQARGITCPECGHVQYARGGFVSGVTRRQGEVLEALALHELAGDLTPTMRELAGELDLKTPSQVCFLFGQLKKKGLLEHGGGARSARLTDEAWKLYPGGKTMGRDDAA